VIGTLQNYVAAMAVQNCGLKYHIDIQALSVSSGSSSRLLNPKEQSVLAFFAILLDQPNIPLS
jgi:hypothetical protein